MKAAAYRGRQDCVAFHGADGGLLWDERKQPGLSHGLKIFLLGLVVRKKTVCLTKGRGHCSAKGGEGFFGILFAK